MYARQAESRTENVHFPSGRVGGDECIALVVGVLRTCS